VLADELIPAAIADVDCPEDADLAPESVFLCAADVEGSFYEIQVTIIDAQGRFKHERRHAVLNVVNTENALSADITTALGFRVATDCGDNEYLVVSVHNTFVCDIAREDGDAQRSIEVEVENALGAITWSLLDS